MVQPKAFLAIERTMIAAMRSQWNKRAKKFIDELHPVLAKGRFAEAHHIIGRMSLNGVVEEVRPKLEELATSAVLFGAHHVHGSVNETSFVKHQKAIPYEAKNAITQLVHMVEADGRDYLAKRLHALVTAFSEKHTALQKYSPDQPRDEHGRWSAGGGAPSGDGMPLQNLDAEGDEPAPIGLDLKTTDEIIEYTCAEMKFPLGRVQTTDIDREFTLNGMSFKYAGAANIDDHKGDITLFRGQLRYATAGGILAHEIGHIRFQAFLNEGRKEGYVVNYIDAPQDTFYDKVMMPNGGLREPYATQFPAYQTLNKLYDQVPTQLFEASDGVSPYSQGWWQAYRSGTASKEQAMHETLAEMTRIKYETDSLPDEHYGHRVTEDFLQGFKEIKQKATSEQMREGKKAWRALFKAVSAMDLMPKSDSQRTKEKLDAALKKDDISDAQLGDTGGLLPPEQVENLGKKRRKKGDRSLYVRRELINTDQFLKWAKEQGFTTTLPADDLHVTVCYSKTPVDWDDAGNSPSEVSAAYDPRRVTQFGGGAVVLEFTCGELVDRNTALRTIGATSDFPGFSPHVTITYDPGSVDIGNVSPYDGLLLFGPEIFDECKDGWKDDLDEVALKLDALFKAEGGLTLAEQLNAAVTDGGTVPIDLGASLTTSRLISLGFLSEALDARVETYIVNEILDDKTCLFCEYINGKEFSVAKQHSRLMQTLGTGDPEDLKVLAPWPGSGAADMAGIYGMSLDDLQDGGLGSPPYHPNCRGMLMQVGSTEETVPLGGPVDENGQSAADLIGLLSDMGGAAEADDLSAEVDAWPEEKTTALQDMIDTMDDSDIKDAAQDAFDNEDFDGAIGIADAALEDVNPADEEPGEDWTKDKIDALGWDHMEITDPLTFKEADDAFNSEDYDKVQAIVDKWKEANDQA